MKNRNTLIMSGLLALTLGLGVSGTAFAAQDFSKKGSSYSIQFETQMSKVMTNLDYEGWKQLVINKTGTADPLITKDNFPKFAEAWKLAKEGKIKEANVIRKELGLISHKVITKTNIKKSQKIHKGNQVKIKTAQPVASKQ